MINSFPPEILVKILVNLGCLELTRLSCVCRFWKALLENDTYLRCLCFKHPSPYYFDEGNSFGDSTSYPECLPGILKGMNPYYWRQALTPLVSEYSALTSSFLALGLIESLVQFHPTMGRIAYRMGEAMSSVRVRDSKANDHGTCLTNLILQDHYVTIPLTTHMEIEIIPEGNQNDRSKAVLPGIKVSISNPTGIRLRDFFSSIVAETTQLCDLVAYASGGICYQQVQPSLTFLKKAEILGKYKSYTGIRIMDMSKDGLVNVQLCTAV